MWDEVNAQQIKIRCIIRRLGAENCTVRKNVLPGDTEEIHLVHEHSVASSNPEIDAQGGICGEER